MQVVKFHFHTNSQENVNFQKKRASAIFLDRFFQSQERKNAIFEILGHF